MINVSVATVNSRPATSELGMAKSFEEFAREFGDRFTDSMVARFGPQLGVEASAAAMAYAFEHWQRVQAMDRPMAYLYRVAQSSLRPHWRWARWRSASFPRESSSPSSALWDSASSRPQSSEQLPSLALDVMPDIDLSRALLKLNERQRVCVLLVHAYGWTYREVSALLNLTESAVANHVTRGRARLRKLLEESPEPSTF